MIYTGHIEFLALYFQDIMYIGYEGWYKIEFTEV